MCFYDEPYYSEPSEFDEKCEELIDMLRQNANDEIKAEVEKLRKENSEMRDVFDNYNAKVEELERAKRKYEFDTQRMRSEIELEVKKLRLSKLLEDFQTIVFTVRNVGKEKPKCDKCDKDGYIYYLTPRGREAKEWCECREKEKFFEVVDVYCHRFTIGAVGDKRGELVGWYKLETSKYSGDSFESSYHIADKMYKGQDFSEIEHCWDVYFYDIETAQKYADWLNQRGEG